MKTYTQANSHKFFKMAAWQFLLISTFSLLVMLLQGKAKGLSVLMGGLAYWLPSSLFVWCLSRQTGARYTTGFLLTLSIGEILKLVLCGVFFLVAVNFLAITVGYGLLGLSGAIVAYWLTSCMIASIQEAPT